MANAGNEAMIIYMLNKGVDINQTKEYNCTALYNAISRKHFNAAFFYA
ncbi:MAG: ankyrin repeat domain-containing protein [Desulfobacteraceae bacterium]|nr:ankyrin repeat domain-containing protein [Desulfobacteraceae bacterium]